MRSPNGATNDSNSSHLNAAYYSFIDPKRMKCCVGLVSRPTADGLSITHQLQVRCRPGKVLRSETDVLPLSYTANCFKWTGRLFLIDSIKESYTLGRLVNLPRFIHQTWSCRNWCGFRNTCWNGLTLSCTSDCRASTSRRRSTECELLSG